MDHVAVARWLLTGALSFCLFSKNLRQSLRNYSEVLWSLIRHPWVDLGRYSSDHMISECLRHCWLLADTNEVKYHRPIPRRNLRCRIQPRLRSTVNRRGPRSAICKSVRPEPLR